MDVVLGATPLIGRVVTLEPLAAEHLDGLVATASGDRSSFSFTFVPEGSTEMRTFIERGVRERDAGVSAPFTVRRNADGEIVGSTRYMDIDDFDASRTSALMRGESVGPPGPPRALEIGHTWYAPSAQRTAVNTECKLLLLTRAFDEAGVVRVTFKTDARNSRSRTAIERIGASFEGIRRAHMTASDGTTRDTAYFSIIATEWPAVRRRLEQRLVTP